MKTRSALGLVLSVGMALALAVSVRGPDVRAEHNQSLGFAGQSAWDEAAVADGCTTVPTLYAPTDGATLDTLNTLFRWDAGSDEGATSLRLELSTGPEFGESVIWWGAFAPQGAGEWHYLSNLEPDTMYHWRAGLVCGGIQGPWSEVWRFITGSEGTVPHAPALVAPANGSVITALPVTLRWEAVSSAGEYEVCWIKMGSGAFCAATSNTQFTLDVQADPDGVYLWWVTASNRYAVGDASDQWQFTLAASTPTLTRTATQTLVPTPTHTATPSDWPTLTATRTLRPTPTSTPTGYRLFLPVIVRGNST